jgi:E3 ubiquitin-protein ligase DOA10
MDICTHFNALQLALFLNQVFLIGLFKLHVLGLVSATA